MFTFPIGFMAPNGISSPLALPNCDMWLRADLGVTTVSSNVSAWTNQGSDSNLSAAQTSSGSRPAYSSSGGSNNQAYITFNGSKFLTIGNFNVGTSARTIVFVAKCLSLPGTGFTIYTIGGPGTYEGILDLNTYKNVSFIDDWQSGGNMVGYDFTLGTSAVHYHLHTYNGSTPSTTTNYTATQDGTTKTVAASGAYGSSGGGSIGARPDVTFGSNIDLYEMISYSRELTTLEKAALNAYIKARYAL